MNLLNLVKGIAVCAILNVSFSSFGQEKLYDCSPIVDKNGTAVTTSNAVKTTLTNPFVNCVEIDNDKDGINDGLDKCLDTPAEMPVDATGCSPDGDKDGIPDHMDKCPTVAGLESFTGCPDTDGDGVEDAKDKCPKVAGPVETMGCPDTDGDGVLDKDDKCPTVAGTVSGCPDGDSDGVADKDDKCPKEPGTVATKGCPEIKEEAKKDIIKIAEKIYFESGKDVLKESSKKDLDKLAIILAQYVYVNLNIDGHTDSQGKDDLNLALSQKRAEAVEAYLVSKGVDESRLTPTGFGETVPVADNKTSAGRAKNRRVELNIAE